jgi:hypothetical protein
MACISNAGTGRAIDVRLSPVRNVHASIIREEAPAFLYNTPGSLAPRSPAGHAADNLRGGTQSLVNAWSSPFWRSIGYRFSPSLIHLPSKGLYLCYHNSLSRTDLVRV